MRTEIELNYDRLILQEKEHNKTLESLLKSLIKIIPRETTLKVLKERKIIKRDWEQKGEQYILNEKI